MQFIPFKDLKRVTVNVTTIGETTLYTTTADSLVFVNVYNTTFGFGYDFEGQVFWETSGSVAAKSNRVNLWVGEEAGRNWINPRRGAGGGGGFVPSGKAIKQDDIYVLGAGNMRVDFYILELNEPIVPSS